MKWTTCMALLLLAGCRMGPTGGNALALVEPEDDAGVEGGMGMGAGASTGNGGGGSSSTGAMPGAEGGADMDGGAGTDDGGAGPAPSDAGSGSPNACTRPTFAGCDPVENTGCAPLTQCAVDRSSNGATGSCVFGNGMVDAGLNCEENLFVTSCPPMHVCLQDTCLRYCVCDADCNLGNTCSIEVVTGGGGVVKACSP